MLGTRGRRTLETELQSGASWDRLIVGALVCLFERKTGSPWTEELWFGAPFTRTSFQACDNVDEALGAAYESLRSYQPQIKDGQISFVKSSDRRKRDGLFYTPTEMAKRLVALALAGWESGQKSALDPACGSGRLLLALVDAGWPIERLQGFDLDPIAVAVCRANLWLKLNDPCAPKDAFDHAIRYRSAADEIASDDVDLIVMNPPFVSLFARGSKATPEAHAALTEWAKRTGWQCELAGRAHLGMTFLADAAVRLAPGGRLAAILPDAALTNRCNSRVRSRLLNEGSVSDIVRLRNGGFADASVGDCVIVWSKGGQQTTTRYFDGQRIQQVELTGLSAWAPSSTRALPDGFIRLDEIAWVKDGVNPGPRDCRDRILSPVPLGAQWVPVHVGSDIKPFDLAEPGQWLHYDASTISPADRIRGASLRQPWVFQANRIVTRQTANRPIAAIERHGRPTLNSAHNIVLKRFDERLLKALCLWLNSSVIAEWHQGITGETRQVFPQVHIASLRELPVPIAFRDVESELVQWCSEAFDLGADYVNSWDCTSNIAEIAMLSTIAPLELKANLRQCDNSDIADRESHARRIGPYSP